MSESKVYYATGRRKTSSARVFMFSGSGKVTINGKAGEEYFCTASGRQTFTEPFNVTGTKGQFDLKVTVAGGGTTGQAEAIRHGVARTLLLMDENNRGELKKAGLLSRDARKVERKKYGRHKARRSSQFSKR